MWKQIQLSVQCPGRGTYLITEDVNRAVSNAGIITGLAHVFIHHTSASLLVCENADPAVRSDLETFMSRTAPDGDPQFQHLEEGPDDMPAHVRSILTGSGVTIPVTRRRLGLGTWQGLYVYEHRLAAHTRRLTVTLCGDYDDSAGE
ncbi:MAG: secondary thiamine-phosphate synthase enzyme YjbQ [Gammaproteobacteria bacterium]|nr:secondary thiamine-phosphate synthase enzyme YjbQ [Gammaproteobacteria bacterium]